MARPMNRIWNPIISERTSTAVSIGKVLDAVDGDVEVLSYRTSQSVFHDSESRALAGEGTHSAETHFHDNSNAILSLALTTPDRFRSLVDLLPPLIADIFYQYYVLGRTYSQIGVTLFPGRSTNAQQMLVKRGNQRGARALAELVADRPGLFLADAIRWSSRYDRSRHAAVRIRAHRDLGAFVVAPNGQLRELFAPSWSVMGPSSTIGRLC